MGIETQTGCVGTLESVVVDYQWVLVGRGLGLRDYLSLHDDSPVIGIVRVRARPWGIGFPPAVLGLDFLFLHEACDFLRQ